MLSIFRCESILMQHFQLHVIHRFIDIYLEPAKVPLIIDAYGEERLCINSLEEDFEKLSEDVAEDGTESYEFVSIVKVIKTDL